MRGLGAFFFKFLNYIIFFSFFFFFFRNINIFFGGGGGGYEDFVDIFMVGGGGVTWQNFKYFLGCLIFSIFFAANGSCWAKSYV